MEHDKMNTQNLIRYELLNDGISFGIDLSKARKKIFRTLHTSITEEVNAVEEFNRGMKRGDTILVTGDRPRFALMRNFPEDKSDPDLIKLGDLRIGLEYGGLFEWLDMCENIRTVFKPSCTEYIIGSKLAEGLEIALTVSQAEDWGAVAKLTLLYPGNKALKLGITMAYGGITRHGRTFTAAYFDIEKDDLSGNSIVIKDGSAILGDSVIPEKMCTWCSPLVKPENIGQKAVFKHEITLDKGETHTLYLNAGRIGSAGVTEVQLLQSEPELVINRASEYYENLLSGISISTPSKVLDAGFLTAIINLEYDYTGKLWLEGVHWWSSYWPDNYQISAAISLGQLQRARKALDFLGSLESGPCPILMASEKIFSSHIGVYNYGVEEGLPYYLYQLIQYLKHTGDLDLVHSLWDKIKGSVDYLFDKRANSGSGLLDWHLGCNGFLYQADHLAMPGDAASPSIMVSGLLKELSEIADKLGRHEDAENWSQASARMHEKLLSDMWNEDEGVFYNHIDYQGIKHMAHIYTDMVFPVLYSNFSEDIKKKSIDSLYNRLVYETDDGRLLMRMGNLKPTIFGNDNVAPVQICEAARALFETGEADTGFKLLESVALSGTVYTEAPGNFPERLDDNGKGEANYIFGNPIGSYIYSVVAGLFGISLKDDGRTLKCSPAFPSNWDNADLCLPYCSIIFEKNCIGNSSSSSNGSIGSSSSNCSNRSNRSNSNCISSYIKNATGDSNGNHIKAVYTVQSFPARKLEFSILLSAEVVIDVKCNQHAIENKIIKEFGKQRIILVTSEISECFDIEIEYTPSDIQDNRQFKKLHMEKLNPGSRYLLEVLEKKDFHQLDLTDYYNSDSIHAVSAWRNELIPINLSGERTGNTVEIEGVVFKVGKINTVDKVDEPANDSARMILLEHSKSHPFTGEKILSEYADNICIIIGKKIKGLALLYASECQARQTGVDAGVINLNYESGTAGQIPLNVGKNLDSLFSHFAEDTIPVSISSSMQEHPGHPGSDYINLLVIPCDSERYLSNLHFSIDLPDVQMGIIGISLLL